MYRSPCANLSCRNHATGRYGVTLCTWCYGRWLNSGLPTGGYIPSGALAVIAKDYLAYLGPSKAEIMAVVQYARGSRHRVGPWSERPAYSLPAVATRPRPPVSRRLPHLLVGRRKPPAVTTVLAAYSHYHIALHHMDAFRDYARFLAGASFFGRRSLIRPTTKDTESTPPANYRPDLTDIKVLGSHVLKAAKMLGCKPDHGRWITVRYLHGVQSGEFPAPCVVPVRAMHTDKSGDHIFDHVLGPKASFMGKAWERGLRRHTGFIRGRYPHELDVPLRDRPDPHQALWASNQVQRIAPPPTDWLFG